MLSYFIAGAAAALVGSLGGQAALSSLRRGDGRRTEALIEKRFQDALDLINGQGLGTGESLKRMDANFTAALADRPTRAEIQSEMERVVMAVAAPQRVQPSFQAQARPVPPGQVVPAGQDATVQELAGRFAALQQQLGLG